jgi:hypothetical protein
MESNLEELQKLFEAETVDPFTSWHLDSEGVVHLFRRGESMGICSAEAFTKITGIEL